MRTDSKVYSRDFILKTREYIIKRWGNANSGELGDSVLLGNLSVVSTAGAAAAATGRNGGGNEDPKTPSATTDSLLHEAPEFALTYLLQILAHHPDFPPCGPATGGGPFPAAEELTPFAVRFLF